MKLVFCHTSLCEHGHLGKALNASLLLLYSGLFTASQWRHTCCAFGGTLPTLYSQVPFRPGNHTIIKETQLITHICIHLKVKINCDRSLLLWPHKYNTLATDCPFQCVWVIVPYNVSVWVIVLYNVLSGCPLQYVWVIVRVCVCVCVCVWVIVLCNVSEWLCFAMCLSDCP